MKMIPFALRFALPSTLLLFATACATPGQSVGAGAAGGALLGAGVGAIADPGDQGQNRFRNVVIGSAIGGALGAGAGFMMGSHLRNERQDAHEEGKAEVEKAALAQAASTQGSGPQLLPAKTEARWIPDQVRGSTFVPGHFEYQIVEPAHWSTGSR